MTAQGRDKVTAPFETFWYLNLGSGSDAAAQLQRVIKCWEAEQGIVGADGDDGDLKGLPSGAAAELLKAAESPGAVGADGRGEGVRCRLGVGFKKRRGTPGYHTLLDQQGLLVGRPAPEGWAPSRASE
jgi:hypothetical protein